MAWLTQRIGSAAIFWGGGPEGRRWWAFVNLADRSPLFQQLRSHLKSLAPCAGSSWATGIQARPRAGTHTAATYCNPARRQRLRRTASTEVTLGAQNMSSTQPTVRIGGRAPCQNEAETRDIEQYPDGQQTYPDQGNGRRPPTVKRPCKRQVGSSTLPLTTNTL